ncbi:O-antigen ligase family protein [Desulfovulcanus sp.]
MNLDTLKNKRNLYFFILWICFIASYLLGPYVGISSPNRFHDPKQIFILVNKIFVLYFVACICIDEEKKLKYLMIVMVISVMYLIYWANAQYLIYHRYGRIGGPTGIYGGGIYGDENAFAMLFVTGLPFLYYLGWYVKSKLLRYAIWLVIPFGWHAIFLTGSRGGLLGLGATIIVAAFRSPKKLVGLAVIPLFIIAYTWQAGSVMKQRAATIESYEQESSAEARINAWRAATKMMAANPILGVGLSAFGPAFPDYSDKKPREAHNTFFQIAAESGIIAGVMYLLVLWNIIFQTRKRSKTEHKTNFLYFANETILTSIIGFAVCSMFLSLQVYEVFYYLCVIANVLIFLGMRENLNKDSDTTIGA